MKPSEQNKQDRELLATAIERADEKTTEVFEEWLIKLEAPPRREVLTEKQRAWAHRVCDDGIEIYENLVSDGKVPRGREVPTPAVLLNRPLKPPGRR